MDKFNDYNVAIKFILVVFIIGILFIIGQLFKLQIIQYNFYKSKSQQIHLTTVEQQIGRGTIYDRNRKALALSVKMLSVCASPVKIKNKIEVAKFLSEKLNLSFNEILQKLKSKKRFVYIKRKVDIDIVNEIEKKSFTGIFTQIEEKRFYPMKTIGAHIVGFTDIDNNGLEGIEFKYDKFLKGKKGRILVKKDALGRIITVDKVDIKKAEKGADIFLTIDSNIQHASQRELRNVVLKYKAKAGSIIVMNPNTGAIYAIANYPEFDPNRFNEYNQICIRNRAITDMFEPGSTFKIFPMAAYLKEFSNCESEKVYCGNGKYFFFNRYVNDHEKYGWLTVPEVIKYSSNIGMVNLTLKLKQDKLYNEFVNFGFGKNTGIDLPGEANGILRNYKEWDNTTLTSIPYGQEIAVTAIQLARAYSAIANGGYLVTPYVVEKIVKNDNVIFENKVDLKNKILDEKIRTKLVDMLKMVIEKDGTGKKAYMKDYSVAGKTGTAQKHDEKNKGYKKNVYVASFVGFAPADKPEVLTLVVIDEPNSVIYSGGDVAAPVFSTVTKIALSYLRTPMQYENSQIANRENIKMPDFSFKNFKEAKDFLKENNINYKKIGFGNYIINQQPLPGQTIDANSTVFLYLADIINNKTKIYMPDVTGYPTRKVIEILSVYGLKINCTGNGIAVSQDPKPGVAVEKGKICTINFELKEDI